MAKPARPLDRYRWKAWTGSDWTQHVHASRSDDITPLSGGLIARGVPEELDM